MSRRPARGSDFYDIHHLYYPRSAYRTKLEKVFRELPCHKVRIHRRDHNQIHANDQPPRKPDRAFMFRVIQLHREGKCDACRANARGLLRQLR